MIKFTCVNDGWSLHSLREKCKTLQIVTIYKIIMWVIANETWTSCHNSNYDKDNYNISYLVEQIISNIFYLIPSCRQAVQAMRNLISKNKECISKRKISNELKKKLRKLKTWRKLCSKQNYYGDKDIDSSTRSTTWPWWQELLRLWQQKEKGLQVHKW